MAGSKMRVGAIEPPSEFFITPVYGRLDPAQTSAVSGSPTVLCERSRRNRVGDGSKTWCLCPIGWRWQCAANGARSTSAAITVSASSTKQLILKRRSLLPAAD
jgi:hypothetical protein